MLCGGRFRRRGIGKQNKASIGDGSKVRRTLFGDLQAQAAECNMKTAKNVTNKRQKQHFHVLHLPCVKICHYFTDTASAACFQNPIFWSASQASTRPGWSVCQAAESSLESVRVVLLRSPPVCRQCRFTTLKKPSTLLLDTVQRKELEGFLSTVAVVLPARFLFLTTVFWAALFAASARSCEDISAKGHL